MPIIGRNELQKNQINIRLSGEAEAVRAAAGIVATALEGAGRSITRINGPVTTESDPQAVHMYISVKREEES